MTTHRPRLNKFPSHIHKPFLHSISIPLTQGGVQFNVVPAELTAGFNIRVPPSVDFDELEEKMKGWCKEAGQGITMKFDNQVCVYVCVCDCVNVYLCLCRC